MLIKLSLVSALTMTSAGTLMYSAAPASAAPCPGAGSGGGGIDVCAGTGTEDPDGNGGGGGNGGAGNGDNGPNLGCDNGAGPQVDCDPGVNPGLGEGIPTISVANMARDRLEPVTPQINTAPSPKTYVGVRTSFWIDQGGFQQLEAEAAVPGQVVTAIATPKNVTWNLAEKTITCNSAGDRISAGCSYTYARSSASQPNEEYLITATTTWTVAWSCVGVGCGPEVRGTLEPLTTSSSLPLAVGEIQTGTQPR